MATDGDVHQQTARRGAAPHTAQRHTRRSTATGSAACSRPYGRRPARNSRPGRFVVGLPARSDKPSAAGGRGSLTELDVQPGQAAVGRPARPPAPFTARVPKPAARQRVPGPSPARLSSREAAGCHIRPSHHRCWQFWAARPSHTSRCWFCSLRRINPRPSSCVWALITQERNSVRNRFPRRLMHLFPAEVRTSLGRSGKAHGPAHARKPLYDQMIPS